MKIRRQSPSLDIPRPHQYEGDDEYRELLITNIVSSLLGLFQVLFHVAFNSKELKDYKEQTPIDEEWQPIFTIRVFQQTKHWDSYFLAEFEGEPTISFSKKETK